LQQLYASLENGFMSAMREKLNEEQKESDKPLIYSYSDTEMPIRRTASFRHSENQEKDQEKHKDDLIDRSVSTPLPTSRPIPIK